MRRAALVCACLMGFSGVITAANDPAAGAKNYTSGIANVYVQQAIGAAVRDLEDDKCTKIFDDFTTPDGTPLRARLREFGATPQEYLRSWIWFLDGSGDAACRRTSAAAYTRRLGRIVYVCSTRVAAGSRSIQNGDIIILHEMLHSLGLGENPPSPDEITRRVQKRCGK